MKRANLNVSSGVSVSGSAITHSPETTSLVLGVSEGGKLKCIGVTF